MSATAAARARDRSKQHPRVALPEDDVPAAGRVSAYVVIAFLLAAFWSGVGYLIWSLLG